MTPAPGVHRSKATRGTKTTRGKQATRGSASGTSGPGSQRQDANPATPGVYRSKTTRGK